MFFLEKHLVASGLFAIFIAAGCANTEFNGNAKSGADATAGKGSGSGTGPMGPGSGSGSGSGTGSGTGSGSGSPTKSAEVKIPVGDDTKAQDVLKVPKIKGGSSDNDGVAKFNPKTGEIVGVKPGETTVHVTLDDGTKRDIKVTVTDDAGGPGSGSLGPIVDQGTGSASASGEVVVSDAEIVNNIPGIPVVQVGVNFEDLGAAGDRDHNDAVLCFQGNFKVDGSNVVSTGLQQVTGTTYSGSGCNHNVTVQIIHMDNTQEQPITFDSRNQAPVTMSFKVGSRLEVTMTPYQGCNPGVSHSQHEPDYARVQPNLCNNSGG